MAESGFDISLDELVLAGARRGNLDACEKIYRAYQRPAYNTAVRICRCPEMAHDVCQEAFITVFRKIRQFRGDSPFWGWLRRVVVNHAISAIRKQPGPEHVEFEEYQGSDPGQQQQIGMAMDLETALGQLDDTDRAIVWLHDVEGYRHREIAKLFSRTESFSKTRLARAREQLRTLMEQAETSRNVYAS